jgi:hypothetical protein
MAEAMAQVVVEVLVLTVQMETHLSVVQAV